MNNARVRLVVTVHVHTLKWHEWHCKQAMLTVFCEHVLAMCMSM